MICVVCLVLAYAFSMDLEATLLPKQSQITTFYVGYSYAFAHILVQNYLIHYKWVVVFDVALGLLRSLLVGTGDVKLFVTNILINVVMLASRYQKEYSERKIFYNFFMFRDELKKFKELLGEYLPDSVAVMDKAKQALFCNHAISDLFKQLSVEDITKHLSKYLNLFVPTKNTVGEGNSDEIPEHYKSCKTLDEIIDIYLSSGEKNLNLHAYVRDT
jgi:hypothetical protein